ncbi:MAG: CDP-alcohol phosphatidyltransferase family protein [Verrucomicrobiales bacterium]|nr:CDP-alcohol phosphatidyltransferase family protein [Verrucomicrobiales bacterium]
MNSSPPTRRPIAARNSKWAAATARWLAGTGIRPNHISLLSVAFGAVSGAALALTPWFPGTPRALLLVAAAAGIQLRLLCNLFDGMVAVEGGFRTPAGEIYNELPDRFADLAIFVGAGYAAGSMVVLGWGAAVAAITTAYVRALGASAGAGQQFVGPMAKQHRMALMTGVCLAQAALVFLPGSPDLFRPALSIVVIGCVITMIRRCSRIARALEAK